VRARAQLSSKPPAMPPARPSESRRVCHDVTQRSKHGEFAPPGADSPDWPARLAELHRSLDELEQRSRWSVEWAIFEWAQEMLESTAIRLGPSEGLTGSAPARWRLLAEIDEHGALALTLLRGRAPLVAKNVVASALAASTGSTVAAVREGGLLRWGSPHIPGSGVGPCTIDRLVDAVVERRVLPPLAGLEQRPAARLAFGLALSERERDSALTRASDPGLAASAEGS
jgi:hypothetical protein